MKALQAAQDAAAQSLEIAQAAQADQANQAKELAELRKQLQAQSEAMNSKDAAIREASQQLSDLRRVSAAQEATLAEQKAAAAQNA